jgi:Toprim-like
LVGISSCPRNWGLNPDDVEKVYLPRCILFPYCYDGEVWKLRVRRIGDNIPKDKRYMMVSGSSNGLYRVGYIEPGKPVALFEGEIDALSGAQETDNQIACVATGSNAHARIIKWAMLLARAPYVLLCFDHDNAGRDGVKYWSSHLKNARVLNALKGRKNANDMLMQGDDLAAWLGVIKLSAPRYTTENGFYMALGGGWGEYTLKYLTSVFTNYQIKKLWMMRLERLLTATTNRIVRLEKDGIVYMEGVKKAS